MTDTLTQAVVLALMDGVVVYMVTTSVFEETQAVRVRSLNSKEKLKSFAQI